MLHHSPHLTGHNYVQTQMTLTPSIFQSPINMPHHIQDRLRLLTSQHLLLLNSTLRSLGHSMCRGWFLGLMNGLPLDLRGCLTKMRGAI
jgi:hypothetical protein